MEQCEYDPSRTDLRCIPAVMSADELKMLTSVLVTAWQREAKRLEVFGNGFYRSAAWTLELEHITKLAEALEWLAEVRREEEERQKDYRAEIGF